ncbi:hypothetical protein RBY4I_118 [Rhodobacterales bacterium Y4I]|nr:hypothetical protein RBY4I_118 [Rhodobacterales bacterium Y4I]
MCAKTVPTAVARKKSRAGYMPANFLPETVFVKISSNFS